MKLIDFDGLFDEKLAVYMEENNETFYEYVPLKYLEEPETDEGGYLVYRPGYLAPGNMISADCKNPELAMKFMDFVSFQDEAKCSFLHGIKGVNWDWADPEETDPEVPNVKVLDDGQAFFQGVYTWGRNASGLSIGRHEVASGAETEWMQYGQDSWHVTFVEIIENAKFPDEVVTDFGFSVEEREQYTSLKSLITQYISEARAKFGTGVWDPNNDADWNSYLSELEAIGLQEYLGICQSGYDKMK